MEKILVLGGSGLVGIPLVRLLKKKYEVFYTYHDTKYYDDGIELDIRSNTNTEKVFLLNNPDVVINLCGIYKNLDFCEKNKELTMNVNGLALKSISSLANKFNTFLITISTDQVFDGIKGSYIESDKVCPINHYGKTKAEGEKIVQNIAKKYCIVRTSMLWGKNQIRNTFSEFVLDEIKENKKLKLIQDQTTSPTYIENFCEMLCEVVEKEINGIIHLAGPKKLSRYKFGQKLLDVFNLDKNNILPAKRSEFQFGKLMPRDSSLNIDKARKLLNITPERIEISFQKYLKTIETC